MKHKHLWVLNPCLLVMLTPAAWAEDQLVVSANRSHRSVAEMAQTTWVIEGQELEQQVQGGLEIKRHLGSIDPRYRRQQPRPYQLRHEHAWPLNHGDDRRRAAELFT